MRERRDLKCELTPTGIPQPRPRARRDEWHRTRPENTSTYLGFLLANSTVAIVYLNSERDSEWSRATLDTLTAQPWRQHVHTNDRIYTREPAPHQRPNYADCAVSVRDATMGSHERPLCFHPHHSSSREDADRRFCPRRRDPIPNAHCRQAGLYQAHDSLPR